MRELVEKLVQALVDNPEAVQVTEIKGERTIVYEVRVAEEDLGKVIGKEGRIANALRTILKAAATKLGKKVSLEILQ
ncbi:KH domain-containing protein [bacterium]|nr:KH domain-containing protein [bacterium]